MISYHYAWKCVSMQGSSVASGLTKRRAVDYCRLAAAL